MPTIPVLVVVRDPVTQIVATRYTNRVVTTAPGPQGPQGTPGAAGGTYSKSFVAASTVIVDHNLGYFPSVTILIGGEERDADVTHSSVNQYTVAFGHPLTGEVVSS